MIAETLLTLMLDNDQKHNSNKLVRVPERDVQVQAKSEHQVVVELVLHRAEDLNAIQETRQDCN